MEYKDLQSAEKTELQIRMDGNDTGRIGERIGTNKSYISRVETGRTEPKVSTFYRIVSSLGLSVELT
jgi:predicted transcriptional regulator